MQSWYKLAPFISLLLNIVSLASYALAGKWAVCIYWLGAVLINVSILLA